MAVKVALLFTFLGIEPDATPTGYGEPAAGWGKGEIVKAAPADLLEGRNLGSGGRRDRGQGR